MTSQLLCWFCWTRLDHDPLCSDTAVMVLHWMTAHPEEWVKRHPDSQSYLLDAGLL